MPNTLVISYISIRQDSDGRFCLNDAHEASGGESRHQPANWLRNQQAIDLIEFLKSEESITKIPVILTKQGLGTFAVKELVYAYAMWVSAKFHLQVIRAYDTLVSKPEKQVMNQSPAFNIPTTLSEALLLAGNLAEDKEKAEAKIEADKPKVEFAMAVRNLDGSCLVREFAKILGTGQNRLFKTLRDRGYLMANNEPYQRYIDSGLFAVVEGIPFTDSRGKSHPTKTTRITGKGQVFLEKKLRNPERNGLVVLEGGVSKSASCR